MIFPHESIPDGDILLPHHYYAVLFGLLICVVVYRKENPITIVLSLFSGFFGFAFIWPHYHVVGASITLISTTIALLCVLYRDMWKEYPLKYRIAVTLCIVIALDDAVEHAFPVGTPLDWFWKTYLLQYMA